MNTDSFVRITVIIALLNFTTSTYLLVGRPDLAVRDGSEKVFAAAAALEKEGKFQDAANLYEKIFRDMSVALIAPRAGERLADIYRRRLNDVGKARDILREAASYKESVYAEDAARELAFMDNNWDGDGTALSLWFQASNAYRSGKKSEALELLNRIITEKTKATLRPMVMVRAAKLAKELGNNPQAARMLVDFLAAYPGDTGVAEARTLLMQVKR